MVGRDFTVCVATFGDARWVDLAHERAIPSAREQARVVYAHARTLADARNECLSQVRTEFVVHLDADDEIEAGYIEALAGGRCDMRAPAVRYVEGARAWPPRVPRVFGHTHACTGECLKDGNWLVVGTAVRTDLLRRVGGWWPEAIYEDWSAFLRCWRAGGSVEAIPGAVYRAHVRRDSRNRAPAAAEKERWHRHIYDSVFGGEAA